LLDVPVRVSDLQHLHGREPVGPDVQRRELAVPGLREPETLLKARKLGAGSLEQGAGSMEQGASSKEKSPGTVIR